MKRGKGQPKHQRTEQNIQTVRIMVASGVTQESIARCLGISRNTLLAHYKNEIHNAADELNTQVAASLFKMATRGNNVSAAIFWLKTRMRWRETDTLENIEAQALRRYTVELVPKSDRNDV